MLLDDASILYKITKDYKQIVIPLTVLKELDKLKINKDLSYSARTAITELLIFKETFPDKILFTVDDYELDSNDMKIISTAQNYGADIATKDVSMSIIASNKNVKTQLFGNITNGINKPYIYLNTDDVPEQFMYHQEYTEESYWDAIKMLGIEEMYNGWVFVIINDVIYANNPVNSTLLRIDNRNEYRVIENHHFKLKAKDKYQICAIYAMKEAPNTIITGNWGSGKTLISTAYAISKGDRKVFVARAPVGINQKYEIGYVPGDKEEKMMDWCAGFLSSLYFLYSNTKTVIHDNLSCDFDYVKDKIFRDRFEVLQLNAIQGMSLLHGDTMLVDEVQLIDIDTLSMILSRINKGGKLILLGDLKQTYKVLKPSESGLLKLLRVLPHPSLAHVDLQNNYRDDLLEIADRLQDSSF